MNREEEIARFRNEKLPEYIKFAEEEPWENPIKKIVKATLYTCNLKQCLRCGEWLPITEYFKTKNICKKCFMTEMVRRNYARKNK